jgi:hypothetical protein
VDGNAQAAAGHTDNPEPVRPGGKRAEHNIGVGTAAASVAEDNVYFARTAAVTVGANNEIVESIVVEVRRVHGGAGEIPCHAGDLEATRTPNIG